MPAAEVKDTLSASLTISQPGEFQISWPRQVAWDGAVYQVEVATNPAGPWFPLIGRVLQWGAWNGDLMRTHRTSVSTRFFQIAMVGHASALPATLAPDDSEAVHHGFLQDRNMAFDEAFVTFVAPTDLEQIESNAALRWVRRRVISEAEAWYRAIDGLSTGDRGEDLALQIETLNARDDVKVANPVLVHAGMRMWPQPRIAVIARAGQSYGDLLWSLGGKVVIGENTSALEGVAFYDLTNPKQDNVFELLHRFRQHSAVESADIDGYQEVWYAEE